MIWKVSSLISEALGLFRGVYFDVKNAKFVVKMGYLGFWCVVVLKNPAGQVAKPKGPFWRKEPLSGNYVELASWSQMSRARLLASQVVPEGVPHARRRVGKYSGRIGLGWQMDGWMPEPRATPAC